jgi:hypothetical protein
LLRKIGPEGLKQTKRQGAFDHDSQSGAESGADLPTTSEVVATLRAQWPSLSDESKRRILELITETIQ